MQHVHVIQYSLVFTLGIIILALVTDQYLFYYFPQMSPIQTIKQIYFIYSFKSKLKSSSTNHYLIKNIIIYFGKWYGFWIVLWIGYHYKIFKDVICQLKSFDKECNQSNQKQHQSRIMLYQVLQNNEQQHEATKQQLVQNKDLAQQQSKHISTSIQFQSFIYSQIITLFVIFTIVFLTISLIQFQITIISNSLKNGSQSSKWMGTRQYYTLDFFHNIPKQFSGNHRLIDLFDIQDKAVSAVNNWIANYRLFFGLFYLMLKSLSPIVLFVLFLLIFLSYKINLNENTNLQKLPLSLGYKLKSMIKYSSQVSLFNFIFLLFMGFSILSAIFIQLKSSNSSQLCPIQLLNPKGGIYLSLNKSVQTQVLFSLLTLIQIISEVMTIFHYSQKFSVYKEDNDYKLSRHQILFVFQNICEVSCLFIYITDILYIL